MKKLNNASCGSLSERVLDSKNTFPVNIFQLGSLTPAFGSFERGSVTIFNARELIRKAIHEKKHRPSLYSTRN